MDLTQYGRAAIIAGDSVMRLWRQPAIARLSLTGLWVEAWLVAEPADRPSSVHRESTDEAEPWKIITTKVGASIVTLLDAKSPVGHVRHSIFGDEQHSVLEYVFNLPLIGSVPPVLEFSYSYGPLGLDQTEQLHIVQEPGH